MVTFDRRQFAIAAATAFAVGVGPARADDAAAGKFADLPGVKLWFTDTGGNGAPLVLLHANTGTVESWEPQTKVFAQAGYRVIAFDRRGWGKSVANPQTGPQPGSVSEDLDALADYLKLPKFHLVGVAGGGFVALDYAAWRTQKVRSLVVAASTGQLTDKEMLDIVARVEFPLLRKMEPVQREVGASYRGVNPDGVKRWEEIEKGAQQAGRPSQPLRTPNTLAKLATITAPTLVMAGDTDLVAPPSMMRVWATHVKTHEWINIPEAGHSVAWEQPAAFNAAVLRFVKKH